MSSSSDADDRTGGHVVEHEVPGEDRAGLHVELAGDERREPAGGDVAEPPDRAEVLLGVEEQAVGGDLPIEVDRQLRNPTDRPIDEEQALLGPVAPAEDHPPGQSEIAVEPRVQERAAVHLDGELLTADPPCVGVRLDPQVGAVRVGADHPEPGGGRCAPPSVCHATRLPPRCTK